MSSVGKNRIEGKTRKVISYEIVCDEDSINEMLRGGYELYGSPFNSTVSNYNQAMVKYKEPEVIKLPI